MIEGIMDKVIVKSLVRRETRGGIIVPETAVLDPQGYGKVVSIGPDAKDSGFETGDIIVFHMNGGMAMVFEKELYKVLKADEIYGKLTDKELIEQLDSIPVTPVPAGGEESKIIKPDFMGPVS